MKPEDQLNRFLESIKDINWLAHSGDPAITVRVTESIQSGFDREGKKMLAVWEPEIVSLEKHAKQALGDADIDSVFTKTSEFVHLRLNNGISSYFERRYMPIDDTAKKKQRSVDEGLYLELIDTIKRDVCWAAVEFLTTQEGFFTLLLEWYRKGRWPCSWDGKYPEGNVVIL